MCPVPYSGSVWPCFEFSSTTHNFLLVRIFVTMLVGTSQYLRTIWILLESLQEKKNPIWLNNYLFLFSSDIFHLILRKRKSSLRSTESYPRQWMAKRKWMVTFLCVLKSKQTKGVKLSVGHTPKDHTLSFCYIESGLKSDLNLCCLKAASYILSNKRW